MGAYLEPDEIEYAHSPGNQKNKKKTLQVQNEVNCGRRTIFLWTIAHYGFAKAMKMNERTTQKKKAVKHNLRVEVRGIDPRASRMLSERSTI